MTEDTTSVRPGEELDHESLTRYLRERLGNLGESIEVDQFPGGHSNLTYRLWSGGREYVLRRPPLGPVPPKAHDMPREFRVLSRVAPHFPPAPPVYLLCEDPSIIGAPFFLMERRRGLIVRREVPAELAARHRYAQLVSEGFIDCLADLHAIDIRRHGLDSLGRPDGFLQRQVQGWAGRWERARTHDLPAMSRLAEWLQQHLPTSQPATIVHNDYKIDNLMLDLDDPGRVNAVLDWEMATVGDPLVDLGIVLCYWPQADDPDMRREAISPVTANPGWFSRRQLLERYGAATGRDLSGISYYEVFGLYKLAVILQQIYYRYHIGQTSDRRFADFDQRVRGLAEAAVVVMETSE